MGKGILVFNKNKNERLFLSSFLKDENYPIFATPYALEAIKILQKEDIGVIIAGRGFRGMDDREFRAFMEKIRPGVGIIFITPFSEKDKEFSLNTEELLKLIHDYLKAEYVLPGEVTELKQFFFALIDRLLQLFEVNDRYFFNNDHYVAELSRKVAAKMGLDENTVVAIGMAALLRDLGKVGIHEQILGGSRRLSRDELIPIKEHPIQTVQILSQIKFPWDLNAMISQHHEHYDGSGYPKGLRGRDISIGARIIAVADAYYAMTTDRPYRRAVSGEKAVQEITKNAGIQFDPGVVEAFLSVIEEEPSRMVPKKSILIFEREENIAAIVKLSTDANEMDMAHVTSGIDAIGYIEQKNPDLIIADVETLNPDAFMKFFEGLQQAKPEVSKHFLLIVPDENYPKNFRGNVNYITRPLNIGELNSKIRSLLFEASKPQISPRLCIGLTGSLEEFSLTDIIQVLNQGLKTARVEVTRGRENGVLYLALGRLIHASLKDLKGVKAFYEIVGWDKGKFCITHGLSTDEINIQEDTTHVLLEANAILDKKKAWKFSPARL